MKYFHQSDIIQTHCRNSIALRCSYWFSHCNIYLRHLQSLRGQNSSSTVKNRIDWESQRPVLSHCKGFLLWRHHYSRRHERQHEQRKAEEPTLPTRLQPPWLFTQPEACSQLLKDFCQHSSLPLKLLPRHMYQSWILESLQFLLHPSSQAVEQNSTDTSTRD